MLIANIILNSFTDVSQRKGEKCGKEKSITVVCDYLLVAHK